MHTTPQQILIDAVRIRQRVAELAQQIQGDLADRELTVIGVMSGAVVFLADLIRQIDLPMRVEFIKAGSYRGEATHPGELVIDITNFPTVTNEHVLLVDDIFDTGHTMASLCDILRTMQPASLSTAVLLWKVARNETSQRPDYFGFEIPDRFVVGYGLDYDGKYRNLPEIRVLDE